MRKPFIAGNWKMYKTAAEAEAYAEKFRQLCRPGDVRVAIAAPFTQLSALSKALEGSGIAVAAQNMHFEDAGAFTGEISPAMIKETGAKYCIIGHSERRQYFGETDETVNKKVRKALAEDILPIVCVGESLEIREAGTHEAFVEAQVKAAFEGVSPEDAVKVTVAYEPIWAIGTGKTASAQQAQDMCASIRNVLCGIYGGGVSEEIAIQYGGSVKPGNITELMNMDDIDGALVGGASLDPESFVEIVHF